MNEKPAMVPLGPDTRRAATTVSRPLANACRGASASLSSVSSCRRALRLSLKPAHAWSTPTDKRWLSPLPSSRRCRVCRAAGRTA